MMIHSITFFYIPLSLLLHLPATKSHQNDPPGHILELGFHRASQGHIDVLTDVPSPLEFWQNFAEKGKPVLFRGAAKHFPAFKLWTDEYLKHNFGNLELKLEAKHEKDETPNGARGWGRDTLGNFLDTYRTRDAYVVSQLPDPMTGDVNILPCMACGSFSNHLLEADLWLSSGGTSSLLHRDADNAMNCLLNGTKDWILIDPMHEKNIPIAHGDHGHGGFAVLDVDHVNLLKYPDFQQVPWTYANMTPGDCLYLPYGHWHQVRSYGSKNMAVSVLFSRLKEFDLSGCGETGYESRRLSDVAMVWTYTGYGPQTLGNTDPFELRDTLVEILEKLEQENQTFDSSILYHELVKANAFDRDQKVIEELYQMLLRLTNGDISDTTIRNLSLDQLKTLASHISEDPTNTGQYEYIEFSPKAISQVILQAMEIDDGYLTRETLTQQYNMIDGGSQIVSENIFSQMDLNNDGVVNKDEMSKTIKDVLQLFEEKTTERDLSYDYYIQELAKDKRMRNQGESHDEL